MCGKSDIKRLTVNAGIRDETVRPASAPRRLSRAGSSRVTPSFELYNTLNSSVVVNALQAYGPTFLRPVSTLPARLMRLGAQFKF